MRALSGTPQREVKADKKESTSNPLLPRPVSHYYFNLSTLLSQRHSQAWFTSRLSDLAGLITQAYILYVSATHGLRLSQSFCHPENCLRLGECKGQAACGSVFKIQNTTEAHEPGDPLWKLDALISEDEKKGLTSCSFMDQQRACLGPKLYVSKQSAANCRLSSWNDS